MVVNFDSHVTVRCICYNLIRWKFVSDGGSIAFTEDLRLHGVMLVVLSVVCIGTRCILQDIMASIVLSAVNHVPIVAIVVSAVDHASVVDIVVQ